MSDNTQAAAKRIPQLGTAEQAQVLALIAIAEALERIAAVKEDERPVIKRGRPRTASK